MWVQVESLNPCPSNLRKRASMTIPDFDTVVSSRPGRETSLEPAQPGALIPASDGDPGTYEAADDTHLTSLTVVFLTPADLRHLDAHDGSALVTRVCALLRDRGAVLLLPDGSGDEDERVWGGLDQVLALPAPVDGQEERAVRAGEAARGCDGTPAPFGLTPREIEVLALLGRRYTSKEIAQVLCLSPRTVDSHVGVILDKLGARNRREAAQIAGLLELAPHVPESPAGDWITTFAKHRVQIQ
jgi:DNA-binding CsgD family transcriptional regulator